jgi:hypothetical protein
MGIWRAGCYSGRSACRIGRRGQGAGVRPSDLGTILAGDPMGGSSMKSPETNLEHWSDGSAPEIPAEDALDVVSFEAGEHATAVGTPEAYRPSLWDALVGYWSYGEPQPSLPLETRGDWLLDEDDFSSEHGYQAGFEGRSEFQYGEFDRWI